jgi:restriction endonuclease S subunit
MSERSTLETGQGKGFPEGWRLAKLGDICEITMGTSPRGHTYNRDGIGEPLLNGPTEFGPRHPSAAQWTTDAIRFAEPGDILFCVRGATTGRKNFADRRYCIGRGLAAIRGRDELAHTDFLWHVLDVVTNELVGRAAGSTFVNLPGAELKRFHVPLPPLAEQKRIAGILKEQLAAVERARAAAEAQLEAAQALPAAYLREVLSSAESAGWPVRRLGDVLTGIEAGKCVSCVERPADLTEWGVLKVSAVTWGTFKPAENKVLPDGFDVPVDREVRVGDFLISRSNTTELVGAVVHVKQTRPRLMLSDKTLRLVPRVNEILPEYMELALRSPQCRSFIEEKATGASSSMKNITQDTIRDIPLPVPPIDEQRRIMAKVSQQLTTAESICTALEEQLVTIDRMQAALLRSAFEGKL